jgi:hypothetical protein
MRTSGGSLSYPSRETVIQVLNKVGKDQLLLVYILVVFEEERRETV